MSVQPVFALTRTEIASLKIIDLADQFGTPSYFYDADVIRNQIDKLRAFDVIRFAQKANSNIAILDLMKKNNVVVDAVSMGELHRAKTVGYQLNASAHEVVFTADIFDRQTLEYILEHDVHVNAGSPDMIQQYGERRPGGSMTLRINPGFGHGHTQKTNTGGEQSKHGIWHDQIGDALKIAARHQIKISGLHMHIGSGTDFEHLSQVCDAMLETARLVGSSVDTISAGGGLPTPYRLEDQSVDIARYFDLWDETRNLLQNDFGHTVKLEIEPGRYLVAECGYLVAEIRAVKQMGRNLFYLLDAGFNDLARPIMYGAYHPMSVTHRIETDSDELLQVVVGGPLCESGDIFTQEEGGFVSARELPKASVGDLLTIECAGAYGAVMASNYNSRPFSAEVLLDKGKSSIIRRRQTCDDLIAGEQIPK